MNTSNTISSSTTRRSSSHVIPILFLSMAHILLMSPYNSIIVEASSSSSSSSTLPITSLITNRKNSWLQRRRDDIMNEFKNKAATDDDNDDTTESSSSSSLSKDDSSENSLDNHGDSTILSLDDDTDITDEEEDGDDEEEYVYVEMEEEIYEDEEEEEESALQKDTTSKDDENKPGENTNIPSFMRGLPAWGMKRQTKNGSTEEEDEDDPSISLEIFSTSNEEDQEDSSTTTSESSQDDVQDAENEENNITSQDNESGDSATTTNDDTSTPSTDETEKKGDEADKQKSSTNNSSTSQESPPMLPQLPTSPIILLGGPSSSGLSPFGRLPPQPPRGGMPPIGGGGSGDNGDMPSNMNSQLFASILASIMPIVSRTLLLLLLSGPAALFGGGDYHSIYSPNPSQHFMFERLNDRYDKDGVAMKRALEHTPKSQMKYPWQLILSKRKRALKKIILERAEQRKKRHSNVHQQQQQQHHHHSEEVQQEEQDHDGQDVEEVQNGVPSENVTTVVTTSSSPETSAATATIEEPKQLPQLSLYSRTVIVMDVNTMDEDMDSTVEYLRDAVSFILRQYHDTFNARLDMGEQLEVILCVESPGGVVQDFGLAADQVTRLKEAGLENGEDLIVTVCVDRIAASGGYMISCQASPGQLLAAPFAVVGSIGVLRETINYHDVLQKYGVKPLLMTAGDAKAPLTSTTNVTEEGLAYVQKNLDSVHDAFRFMVLAGRGNVIDEADFIDVTQGDIYLGREAQRLGLVDRVMTSDDYISERINAGDRVLRLHKYDKSRTSLKFSPLDLLLLKSNGVLGKLARNISPPLQLLARVMRNPLLRIGANVGLIRIVENYLVMNAKNRRDLNRKI